MRRSAVAIACLLLVTACGGGGDPPRSTQFVPTESNPYVVEITYPQADATLTGSDVLVAIAVRGFNVVDKLGEDAKKGEGHVHYYLDVAQIPTTPGKAAVTDDDETYHATASTSHTWTDVEPGEHTLGVQLVNNDHTPLEPPSTHEVQITVPT